MIKLFPGLWALRSAGQLPFEVLPHKTRPEVFHVGNDIYFADGTPAAPGLFETPSIVMVMTKEAAQEMGIKPYDPDSGYKRGRDDAK